MYSINEKKWENNKSAIILDFMLQNRNLLVEMSPIIMPYKSLRVEFYGYKNITNLLKLVAKDW